FGCSGRTARTAMALCFGSTGPWPEKLPQPSARLSTHECARSLGLLVAAFVQALGDDRRWYMVSGYPNIAGKIPVLIGTVPLTPERGGDVRIHGDEVAFEPDVPMVAAVRAHPAADHHALIVDAEGQGIDCSGHVQGREVRSIFQKAVREAGDVVDVIAAYLVPIVDTAAIHPLVRDWESEE